MKFPILETERLFIRPTQKDDVQFILNLLNSPKWIQFIGDRQVKTLQDAENYIETKMLPQLERLGFSNNTIILKSNGEKIGVCGLYDRDGIDGLDIGFAFLPEFEKKGYAFESAQKIISEAFSTTTIKKISAITTHENVESQNLLEKLNFKYVEIIQMENDPEEVRLYKLYKSN